MNDQNPKNIDKRKFQSKPIHRYNGIPWPRIDMKDLQNKIEVPLKENYLLRSMDYLDTTEARPIFDTQKDIIINNQFKGIVDVGCRIGILNDYLYQEEYKDYNYMGFDTSPQPISYAKERWSNINTIEYRVANLLNKKDIQVNFKVDCVIWSGILLYFPNNHFEIFSNIQKFYNSPNAIIQEPCKDQDEDKWINNLHLNTIENDIQLYRKYFKVKSETVVNCNIFSGKRRIIHTCRWEV